MSPATPYDQRVMVMMCDASLVEQVKARELPPDSWAKCSGAAKRKALLTALRNDDLHIVYAMQPCSEQFRAYVGCVDLDEQFLLEAMSVLCYDASRAGLEHPPPNAISWLLEHGAPVQPLLNRKHPRSCIGGLRLLGQSKFEINDALNEVVACVMSKDSRIRCAAVRILGCPVMAGVKSAAAPIVAKCLEDTVQSVCDAAASTLGCLGEDGVKEAAYALHHQSASVRGLAARALGFAGPLASAHTQTLLSWLKSEDAALQIEAIRALGHIGNSTCFDIAVELKRKVRSADDGISKAAITALGDVGSASGRIDNIMDLLDDKNPFVQDAANAALKFMWKKHIQEKKMKDRVMIK